jgi:hypothetical protein
MPPRWKKWAIEWGVALGVLVVWLISTRLKM